MVVDCPYCKKKNVSGRHPQLCGKNPNRRGIKKGGKHKIHKTAGKQSVTSQAAEQVAAAPAESSKLKIVSLKQEYDKNMEKLNPVKKDGKEKKYQCGACGCMFDNLNDGKCPDCGEQLQ